MTMIFDIDQKPILIGITRKKEKQKIFRQFKCNLWAMKCVTLQLVCTQYITVRFVI